MASYDRDVREAISPHRPCRPLGRSAGQQEGPEGTDPPDGGVVGGGEGEDGVALGHAPTPGG